VIFVDFVGLVGLVSSFFKELRKKKKKEKRLYTLYIHNKQCEQVPLLLYILYYYNTPFWEGLKERTWRVNSSKRRSVKKKEINYQKFE